MELFRNRQPKIFVLKTQPGHLPRLTSTSFLFHLRVTSRSYHVLSLAHHASSAYHASYTTLFFRISRFVRVSLFLLIGHAPCGEEYDRSAEYSAIGAHAALITGLRSAGCAEDSANRRICELVSYRTENSSHFTFRLYGWLSGRAVRIRTRIALRASTRGRSSATGGRTAGGLGLNVNGK